MTGERKAIIVIAIIVALAGLVLGVGIIVSARFDRSGDVGDCAPCRISGPDPVRLIG